MKVLVKGAGDLATGIAWRLYRCGFQVGMTDIQIPTTVRRTVAFSRAIYEGSAVVEGVKARYAHNETEFLSIIADGEIPVLADEKAAIVYEWNPMVVVDAIIAKRNTGTTIHDAPLVIGVGPGFTAGLDCSLVVETKRGHYLGRVIEHGEAIPNTGIPGDVGGFTTERIIRASAAGIFEPKAAIGDQVEKDELVALSGGEPVYAQMSGIVRGMLQEGVVVTKGMKAGDIDARCDRDHCYTISDKARSIGGGVLEAILSYIPIIK